AAAALAGLDRRDDAFIDKKLLPPLIEIGRVPASSGRASALTSAAPGRLDRLIGYGQQFFIGVSMTGRLELSGDIGHRRDHCVFSTELPPKLLKVLLVIDDSSHNIALHRSIGSRRPRFGIGDDREIRR